LKPKKQKNPYQNPWPIWAHFTLFLWKLSWLLFCSWTPKFFNPLRLLTLKIFGATISGTPFVHSKAQIQVPWHLILHHRACLGKRANAYSLGTIEIMEGATVAQEAYLCTGTHDFNSSSFQLITKKITVEDGAFVGVRAMIMPGITIGKNAVVGAQSVITKNVKAHQIVAGNPAREIGIRKKDE
jgi:putative colanic acid biosynthesis acetyltransferase WcaF